MLLCLICGEVFEPKPDEADFLEELFGLRVVECPKCGSFQPFHDKLAAGHNPPDRRGARPQPRHPNLRQRRADEPRPTRHHASRHRPPRP